MKILFSLLICLLPTSKVFAAIDLMRQYSCSVIESNQESVLAVGTTTARPLSLDDLKTSGLILLSSADHRMIDFYGPLEGLNTFRQSSNYLTLVKSTGEVQGTIRVEPNANDGVVLRIALTQMGRAFDQAGRQSFVIANSIEIYALACEPK